MLLLRPEVFSTTKKLVYTGNCCQVRVLKEKPTVRSLPAILTVTTGEVCLDLIGMFSINYVNIINFICRPSYPQIHKFFEARPTHIQGRWVHEFIEVDGKRLYMSAEIEDMLASGSNWMHTGASVHQNNFELLQWVEDRWVQATRDFQARGIQVCS